MKSLGKVKFFVGVTGCNWNAVRLSKIKQGPLFDFQHGPMILSATFLNLIQSPRTEMRGCSIKLWHQSQTQRWPPSYSGVH